MFFKTKSISTEKSVDFRHTLLQNMKRLQKKVQMMFKVILIFVRKHDITKNFFSFSHRFPNKSDLLVCLTTTQGLE